MVGLSQISSSVRADIERQLAASVARPGTPGVGIDAEEIDRWTEPDLRLFTPAEQEHCLSLGRSAEGFAGRWCAKEAVVKAISGFVSATIRDVEIVRAPGGRPVVNLSSRFAGLGLEVAVSITHTRSLAMAVAVAYQNSPSNLVR